MYVPMITPSLVAIPNKEINPTQTATLRLIVCIGNKSRILIPASEKFINQGCPYNHIKIKPPENATNTPEKWIQDAVTVLNWKQRIRNIRSNDKGTTIINRLFART